MTKLRVAIIGAGSAGLASAKYAKEMGLECVVYEQWSEIGGLWVYTDYTDFDEYGYPVLSAMYQGLTTNLPKNLMGFSDFPIPDDKNRYLTHNELKLFLHSYADHFQLKPLIKLNTFVNYIKPDENNNNKWIIETEYKLNGETTVNIFDAVMICTGHHHTPKIPDIPGINSFKGTIIHSRMYRSANNYKGKVVLVIGGGASGVDIADQVSAVAKNVVFNFKKVIRQIDYRNNVIVKEGNIAKINELSVTFSDKSTIYIDSIILCTGYYYNYSFLDKSCGITDGNFVQPLYKHVININNPTMAFIGVTIYVCPFVTFELQARFFINCLLGIAKLCSQEEMRKDYKLDLQIRFPNGCNGREYHKIHDRQLEYSSELARLGNTFGVSKELIESYIKNYKIFTSVRGSFKDKY
ncbi:uncharacterized protein [Onthophagus taurus]|uniref:uncharacterized protein n=1 Tax=Onthophagus taurus TaxID=166361 RepID=UPI000C205138|nr:flavin-containing monooxygenase FMO GS-OX-like 1 [Onthophagus taurus]